MRFREPQEHFEVGDRARTEEETPVFYRSRAEIHGQADGETSIDIILCTGELYPEDIEFTVIGIYEAPTANVVEWSTEDVHWDSKLYTRWYKVRLGLDEAVRFLPCEYSVNTNLSAGEKMARELECDFTWSQAKQRFRGLAFGGQR